jgi:rSAM/selenodomain-associated transferase 2
MKVQLAVIIPTLNEAQGLPGTLAPLLAQPDIEVIIVDGGSSDATPALAETAGCRVLKAPRGRGWQMNVGAAATTAPMLLFLHADTLLPPTFKGRIAETLNRPGVSVGAFSLAFSGRHPKLAVIAHLANLRSRLLGLPYGDQALFTTRRLFARVGGYPEMEIMEDVVFVRRLSRLGRVVILPEIAITSARRWQNLGLLRTTALNQLILLGYALGVPTANLARWYQRLRGVTPRR